jgi:hypothetical protein
MALSLRHWILGTTLGCAVIVAAYLPPEHGPAAYQQPWEYRPPTPERQRFVALDAVRGRSRRQLALLEQRDAALGRAGTARPGTGTLLLEPALGPAASARLRAAFAAIWRELGPTRPEVAVIVTVVSDSAAARTISNDRIYYFLPSTRTGRTCLTLWSGVTWRILRGTGEDTLVYPIVRRMIGPCAFYAAFGIPGQPVERWLAARDFDLGFVNDWHGPPLVPATQTFPRRWLAQQVYGGSFAQVSCLAGRRADCHAAVLDTQPPEGDPSDWGRLPRVVEQQVWSNGRPARWLFRASTYLVDLLREQGPERFAQFWHSALPVDSAFQAAFGSSIEEWTARRQARHFPQFRVGGGIPLVSGLLALLVAGVVLAGGAYLTARRQVA